MYEAYVSDCCGGTVETHEPKHEGDTGYYYCGTCGKGCNPVAEYTTRILHQFDGRPAMDVNAITAALQDLLGPDVVETPEGWHRAGDVDGWALNRQGGLMPGEYILLSAADLDKLHAASQIVRRMAGADNA